MGYVANYIYGLMKTRFLWNNKAENQNCRTIFSENPHIEYQQNLWKGYEIRWKFRLLLLLNKALLWLNTAANYNFPINFRGTLWCRILTICVKRFKRYMKSQLKAWGKPFSIIAMWMKIGILEQCFVETLPKRILAIQTLMTYMEKVCLWAHVNQALFLITMTENRNFLVNN
jgi:hypothetical protein